MCVCGRRLESIARLTETLAHQLVEVGVRVVELEVRRQAIAQFDAADGARVVLVELLEHLCDLLLPLGDAAEVAVAAFPTVQLVQIPRVQELPQLVIVLHEGLDRPREGRGRRA